jgi:hypothetical protein
MSKDKWTFLDKIGADAVVPPREVLDRAPTPRDVRAYPDYFILGAGEKVARTTQCSHGYYLTDSCPGCDRDQEQGR